MFLHGNSRFVGSLEKKILSKNVYNKYFIRHSFVNKHFSCNFSNLKIVTRLLRKYGYPGALLIVGAASVSRLGGSNEKTPLFIKLKEILKYPSEGIFKSCTVFVQKKNNEIPKIIKRNFA